MIALWLVAGALAALDPPAAPAPVEAKRALADLPLIEVAAASPRADAMAVVISGDGGWSETDRGIVDGLAAHGVSAVGLNALDYFWRRRTPDEAAADLERVLLHYLPAWKKEKAILIGYSFGADVLPFLVTRLPAELRSKVALVVLVGPGDKADFEFHFSGWLGHSEAKAREVRPEVEQLKGTPILCIYGVGDRDALCPRLDPSLATRIGISGGHRVGAGFQPIVDAVVHEMKLP